MTSVGEIVSLIEQYAKHDWVVRRISLSAESLDRAENEVSDLYPEVTIVGSANEAIWFSRRSQPDREAWELRRLSGSPFALVVVIEDSLSEIAREGLLRDTEMQMFDGSHPEPLSH